MQVISRVDAVLQTIHTFEDLVRFIGQSFRRFINYEQAAVYHLGNEMDVTVMYEETHEKAVHEFNVHKYKAVQFVTTDDRWNNAVYSGTRCVQEVLAPPSAIETNDGDRSLPIGKCVLRPLEPFQISFTSKIGSVCSAHYH
eukprot:jgi/Hompol1/4386/HPOL_007080-RA